VRVTSSIDRARATLADQIAALSAVRERIGREWDDAVEVIYRASGKVIACGLGKSGIVARKIAATLASTGTPAMFLHPVEAVHGDFGMVQKGDVALLLSKSGETPEAVDLLQILKGVGLKSVGIIGRRNSTLATRCDVFLDASVDREACPLNLAPMSSTTVAMVLGDALAACLMERRGFTADDFSKLHPAGALGKRLLLRVRDVMHQGTDLAVVAPHTSMTDTLLTLSARAMGAVVVAGADRKLLGIFTDGDARRCFARLGQRALQMSVDEVMIRHPVVIHEDELAMAALKLMEDRPSQISVLPVLDAGEKVVGIVRIHDLVRAGL
jgi:arabinose-5-phosphate isomerase